MTRILETSVPVIVVVVEEEVERDESLILTLRLLQMRLKRNEKAVEENSVHPQKYPEVKRIIEKEPTKKGWRRCPEDPSEAVHHHLINDQSAETQKTTLPMFLLDPYETKISQKGQEEEAVPGVRRLRLAETPPTLTATMMSHPSKR